MRRLTMALAGSLLVSVGVAAQPGPTITVLDGFPVNGSVVRSSASVAIGNDGLPVISYVEQGGLRVAKCGDAACAGPRTITRVDAYTPEGNWLHGTPSIAIGADGLPVISYVVGWPYELRVAKCVNAACSGTSRIATLDRATVGNMAGGVRWIAIGADGFPVISYKGSDAEGQDVLKVAKCTDGACAASPIITAVDDPPNTGGLTQSVGHGSSIAIGADGLPIIVHTDFYGRLRVAKCVNAACSGTSIITTAETPLNPLPGGSPSVAIGAGGLPLISYVGWSGTAYVLKLRSCSNPACSAGSDTTVVDDPAHWVGMGTAVAVPADGLPIIGYHDDTVQALKVVKCTDAACAGAGTITTVDDPADGHLVGILPSIAIGADGLPIISYYDETDYHEAGGALKVAKCWTPTCQDAGAAARRLSVAVAGLGSGTVSSTTPAGAIACGATCDASFPSGTPVTLTAASAPGSTFTGWHRADCPGVGPCTVTMTADTPVTATFAITTHPVPGGPTITTVDFGEVGGTSVAIGADGLPVIAYADRPGPYPASALKVAACADPACIGPSTITTIDPDGGSDASIALGADGLPVISYAFQPDLKTAATLRVAKCANAACSGDRTITTLDVDVWGGSSIAVGPDGLPVIAYVAHATYALTVAKCANPACTGPSTITVVDVPATVGGVAFASIAIGADGVPVISYQEGLLPRALKVAKCGNAACTGASTITVVDEDDGGWYSSLAIGADGFPVISYMDYGTGALKVAKCANPACTGTGTITAVDEPPGGDGVHTSIVVGADGLPLITYDDNSGPLKVAKCANPACTGTSTISSVEMGGSGGATAIGADGLPVIALTRSNSLKVVKCATPSCQPSVATTYRLSMAKAGAGSGIVTSTTPGGAIACGMTCGATFNPGSAATLVAVASTGSVFLGWSGGGCSGEGACTVTMTADTVVTATFVVATQPVPGGPTITTVDTHQGLWGEPTSLAIGANGLPVIAHADYEATELRVTACADAACTGTRTISVVANSQASSVSLAVGADGLPVISYHDETDHALRVARCASATCTATSSITTVDASGGWNTSIAVGADGLPVISYSGSGLKVAKCADAACTGTSTVTTVEVPSSTRSYYTSTSIAVGADGLPVISFVDDAAGVLKVAKCANAACTGTSTITTLDGPPLSRVDEYASIAIGPDGLPVIAYMASDSRGAALRVARCVNPACTGTSTITVVDDPARINSVGAYPAIAIGADGLPVISYQDETAGTLKVARCANAACTGASTITVVDGPGFGSNFNSVGTYTSIAIGADGFPVIAYQNEIAATLKVAKCWTASCRSGALAADTDQDGLPDDWETRFGLNPGVGTGPDGPDGDPDGDGVTNAQEREAGTHPRGFHSRYLAEGATSSFFDTRLALLNTGDTATTATLAFLPAAQAPITTAVRVPARTRVTLNAKSIAGLATAEFSTKVESDVPLVVDRTMAWSVATPYGAHAETAVTLPALTWYLAEGATHSGFDLFYLLQNPNAAEAQVRVRFLRPTGAPLEKTYTLVPNSRTNIWVDYEEVPGLGTALASTDVSAVVEVLNDQPIIVERAMYFDVPGQSFGAGHESAGITVPEVEWFLAEGATGPYFDLFVLIANPGTARAEVEATYLLPDGTTLVKAYTIAATSRFNIWVDHEDPRLADTAVSTTICSTNGVPIIVERAMWWPGDWTTWHEAHNSAGATTTGTKWALAEGEVDAARNLETYLLIANTSTTPADMKVTLLFEDGTSAAQTYSGIPAKSRFNVPVGGFFPQAAGRRFGAIVESLGATPAQIVVERAMYWDAAGQQWAAGTNALATKVQ